SVRALEAQHTAASLHRFSSARCLQRRVLVARYAARGWRCYGRRCRCRDGRQRFAWGGGAATTGGKMGDAGQQQGAGGTPATGGNAAAGDAGGLVETGGMGNEITGGAGAATGGAAPCGLPEGCTPCSKLTTLNDCTAQTNCHPVFVDPHDCRCATIGCCAHFSSCVDGAQADCAL